MYPSLFAAKMKKIMQLEYHSEQAVGSPVNGSSS